MLTLREVSNVLHIPASRIIPGLIFFLTVHPIATTTVKQIDTSLIAVHYKENHSEEKVPWGGEREIVERNRETMSGRFETSPHHLALLFPSRPPIVPFPFPEKKRRNLRKLIGPPSREKRAGKTQHGNRTGK